MTNDLMVKVTAAVKNFEMPSFTWTHVGDCKPVVNYTSLPVIITPEPVEDFIDLPLIFTPDWMMQVVEVPVELPPLTTREQTLTERFVDAARSVIAEAGTDYIYKARLCSCGCARGVHLYVSNGEGSCLVGRILVRMGISASTLHQYEGASADALVTVLFGRSMEVKHLRETARVLQILNDTGQEWGTALPIVNALV